MKSINWNELSDLGLMERINREILHPFGLAVSRNPDTGNSEKILIADDATWNYSKNVKSKILSKEQVRIKLISIIKSKK